MKTVPHGSLVSLTAIAGGLLAAACGSAVPARVDTVNGRQVEVATAGSGGPATVVFEAGLGEDWTDWDQVASEVSQHTRVFAYSRPGYGVSDPTASPRNPRTIVEELRELLAYEGYAPPYVVVGHSNGGGYMELFAKAHPDEVVGAVLVDPRHRDFFAACEAEMLDWCGLPESLLLQQATAAIAEYRAYPLAAEEIGAASFGSYPVRVLTATDHPVSPAREAFWEAMNASIAAEAPDGEQIIVRGSGHYIQLDRPEVVVQSILDVLPSN
ncbi:MAG TPA: alpha/beta hydrolase [Kofleriaceae bacterium]|nr:alpha/beta hydrolase [Kofleriaceae bacterium]